MSTQEIVKVIFAVPPDYADSGGPLTRPEQVDGGQISHHVLKDHDPAVPQGLNFDPFTGTTLVLIGLKVLAGAKVVGAGVLAKLIADEIQAIRKRRQESKQKDDQPFESRVALPDGTIITIRSDRPLKVDELAKSIEKSAS